MTAPSDWETGPAPFGSEGRERGEGGTHADAGQQAALPMPDAGLAPNVHAVTTSEAFTPRPRAPVYAALDLGTNNCRLLVAVPTPQGFRVIDAFSRIVRLGEGL
ncbi:MAG: Ppx/GppA family phosphatase, partial [Beijerinckiaceae bacterium]